MEHWRCSGNVDGREVCHQQQQLRAATAFVHSWGPLEIRAPMAKSSRSIQSTFGASNVHMGVIWYSVAFISAFAPMP